MAIAWQQTDSSGTLTAGSTITWTAANIGTAASDRIVVFFWNGDTTVASGVTIGGVTATRAVREATTFSGLDIWYAAVPTGTTANIVITASGTMGSLMAAVGSLTGAMADPDTTGTSVTPGVNSVSLNLVVPSGGIGFWWVSAGSAPSTAGSWSTITNDVSVAFSNAATSTEGSYTVAGSLTSTWTGPFATVCHAAGATWPAAPAAAASLVFQAQTVVIPLLVTGTVKVTIPIQ